MRQNGMIAAVMAGAIIFLTTFAWAGDQANPPNQSQMQVSDQVYGSQLMTPQERDEFRARMRAAKSVEEQEQLRRDHHEQMKERAKAQGVTLPDTPPPRGGAMIPPGGKGLGPGRDAPR